MSVSALKTARLECMGARNAKMRQRSRVNIGMVQCRSGLRLAPRMRACSSCETANLQKFHPKEQRSAITQ